MGYTHYWTQKRDFTKAEWATISDDFRSLLTYVQHEQGIPLANGSGDAGTSPEFDGDCIAFNGLGDDSHETFILCRVRPAKREWETQRGWNFCKTAQKPYDIAVTAALCYLATITRTDHPASGDPVIGSESHSVSSDGDCSDFLNGLELARTALPRVANLLDLPMSMMQDARWCAPWVNTSKTKRFEVNFCVDGRGYVLRPKTGESYCFETHAALAQFLNATKEGYGKTEHDIWHASGSFDEARHERIAKAQSKVLGTLFPVNPACAIQPPAFVRPGQMPDNAGRAFCYSVSDLLKLAIAA